MTNVGILRNTIEQMSADAEDKKQETFGVNLTHGDAKAILKGLKAYEERAECKMKAVASEVKYNSPYECTVAGMLSPDYKERFKAEYSQTKIRYEKLKAFCNRIEAAMRTCPGDTKRVAMPEHDCPLELLRDQQRAMGEYLHCLEIRAVIEGIEL